MREVYLDYNASSPLDERVVEAMLPVLSGGVGNASSVHRFGRRQAALVGEAREHVAVLVGGHPGGVVFTSGATEANNLALQGSVAGVTGGAAWLVVSAVHRRRPRRRTRGDRDDGADGARLRAQHPRRTRSGLRGRTRRPGAKRCRPAAGPRRPATCGRLWRRSQRWACPGLSARTSTRTGYCRDRTWCSRFAAEGEQGLFDRSRRPHRNPGRTPGPLRRQVVERRRWGADHIAAEIGLAGTASSSRNGPTSATGTSTPNANAPAAASSNSTITTDPTARSTRTHPRTPSTNYSRTTSPPGTQLGVNRGWAGPSRQDLDRQGAAQGCS